MSDFREEEALGKAYDARLTRRLMTYLRPYKWSALLAVVLTLPVGPLGVGAPFLFWRAIDKYISPGVSNTITASAALHGVAWVSFLTLVALVLSFAVQYLQ